jgi:hypothetical protein
VQSVIRICVLATLATALISTPAGAATSGGAYTTKDGISTQANKQETTPRSGGSTSSVPQPVCTYGVIEEGPNTVVATPDGSFAPLYDSTHSSTNGSWQWKECTDAAGNISMSSVWIPRANPVVLAQQAISAQSLPLPQIATSPSSGAGAIVNLPTWLWIDSAQWSTVTATAAVDGFSVTATASPTAVTWSMGDGKSVTCNGPGTAYNPGLPDSAQRTTCSYSYAKSSASQPNDRYTITASVQWQTTWQASDGTSGQLDTISRSSVTDLTVREIQAVNVTPTGGW